VSTSDDDRILYLSGEPVDSLTPQERAELDELRELLEAPATWAEPDPALEDRIVAAIADEARRERVAEPAAAAPASTEPPATAPSAPKPKTRRVFGITWPLRRPALAFGGLATAAVAIVVAIVLAVSGSGSPAPLQFAMIVSGTSLAPGAHGSATLTKMPSGWEIQLSATGLPHLANGRYYQAWLKNAAGILVPVGTFNDAEHVILWSGAPVTQFRAFSVTEQLANGNPVSSGRRVLVGVAHPVH
jgi:Anti-sigma-K factor rskA